MKSKFSFYILISFLYITGRICLVSTYSFGQEDKRFINLVNLSQFVHAPAKAAIQSEKLTPAHLRKANFGEVYLLSGNAKTYLSANPLLKPFSPYDGDFIEPPPLLN